LTIFAASSKLHTVINSKGELLGIRLTPGNVDNRKPVPDLCQGLFGLLFADMGIKLVTTVQPSR